MVRVFSSHGFFAARFINIKYLFWYFFEIKKLHFKSKYEKFNLFELVGYGSRQTSEECPEAIILMCIQETKLTDK